MLSLENFILCQRVWRPGYTALYGKFRPMPLAALQNAYIEGAKRGAQVMKAVVDGKTIAQSNDVIECKGYQYFPADSVRRDWLEKVDKTADDRACPHGVQFYDVVVGGKRHKRAAWSYEAPQPEMKEEIGRAHV